jgi:hypothetical protein
MEVLIEYKLKINIATKTRIRKGKPHLSVSPFGKERPNDRINFHPQELSISSAKP